MNEKKFIPLIFVLIYFVILLTGLVLPAIISTDKLPLFIIIAILILMTGSLFYFTYFLLKLLGVIKNETENVGK